MSKKPEALRLADALKYRHGVESFEGDAAAELRSQHFEIARLMAENERLRGLLEKIVAADDDLNDEMTYICGRLLEEIKAALRREDL